MHMPRMPSNFDHASFLPIVEVRGTLINFACPVASKSFDIREHPQMMSEVIRIKLKHQKTDFFVRSHELQ